MADRYYFPSDDLIYISPGLQKIFLYSVQNFATILNKNSERAMKNTLTSVENFVFLYL